MHRRYRARLPPDHPRVEHGASCAAPGIERGVVLVTPAAQTGTAARPVALFVIGMPRSGTAALTRVLSLCGGTLPAGLAGANSGNPLG